MNEILSRFEAQMVASWMKKNGIDVMWTDVWRLRPSQVAKKYNVKESDVVDAARRNTEQEYE